MTIDIRVHPKFSSRVRRSPLARIARKTLSAEEAATLSLTIYITTDAEIRRLNGKFHAISAPTDVLAFPAQKVGERVTSKFPNEPAYLGDIVVSYERAKLQARQAGWHIADELKLLAVHGILHLLGYDDLTPRRRARMWKRQEEILGRVAGAG